MTTITENGAVDSYAFEKLALTARDALQEFLADSQDGGRHASQALAKARVASGVLSTFAKLRQSEAVMANVHHNIADRIAKTDVEFAEYIRLSMPHSPLVPALPSGEKPGNL